MQTAAIRGIESVAVSAEVSVGGGLPGISIVGMADSAVQESKLRVRAAIRSAGFEVPKTHVVVNLAPSSVKKSGSGFDLPIALGILASTGQIPRTVVEGKTYVGELSLDGTVRGVNGLFAMAAMVAQENGVLVSGPTDENLEAVLDGKHLVLTSLDALREGTFSIPSRLSSHALASEIDYADIASQDYAKRALQIAVAGRHSIFMVGPPGSGKTMLARRIPTIMPPLSEEEMIESALVHSVCGLDFATILAGVRPFRAPHHSSTTAGLLGGGTPPTPGEVSLAHNGVLFLDEMAEFGSHTLQLLRQPVEEGVVVIARADGVYRMPASFLLAAASNPCPCGYLGDPVRRCTCSAAEVSRYQARIGGPLMDRFDMMLNVGRSDARTVLATGSGVPSSELYEQVESAQSFASWREASGADDLEMTGDKSLPQALEGAISGTGTFLTGRDARLVASCRMDEEALRFLVCAATSHRMSGRGIMKALGVARTIADMEESECVKEEHLVEAVLYRMQDGE